MAKVRNTQNNAAKAKGQPRATGGKFAKKTTPSPTAAQADEALEALAKPPTQPLTDYVIVAPETPVPTPAAKPASAFKAVSAGGNWFVDRITGGKFGVSPYGVTAYKTEEEANAAISMIEGGTLEHNTSTGKSSTAPPTTTPTPTTAKVFPDASGSPYKAYPPPPPKPLDNMTLVLKYGPLTILRAKVYGGPYSQRPAELDGKPTFGIKMAKEIAAPSDVKVDCGDFQVPPAGETLEALTKAVDAILAGKTTLYVGCMGGTGRTGTFLALLAKAFRVGEGNTGPDPVQFVRSTYRKHAVETPQQYKFVVDTDVSALAASLGKRALWRWVRRGFRA